MGAGTEFVQLEEVWLMAPMPSSQNHHSGPSATP